MLETQKTEIVRSRMIFFWLSLILFVSLQLHAAENAQIDNVPFQKDSLNYQQLYQYNGQKLLWFDQQRVNLSGLSLLSLLADLGIRSQTHLHSEELADINKTDFHLTQHLYDIAMLFNGHQLKSKENPALEIVEAIQSDRLADYVDNILPQFNEVILLRAAIARFRRLSQLEWPNIAEDFNPSLGQGHPEVVKVRTILFWLGDLNKQPQANLRASIYDPEVANAVKRFQFRHHLSQSGKLDLKTINALNRTPHDRIKVLQINLWRWLSLPSVPPSRYVLVNIPSYRLHLFESGQEVINMKVIVGKSQHPTPVMVTEIDRITINPSWTPTANIIKNDLLPLHQRDKNFLTRHNFSLRKGYGSNTMHKKISNHSDALTELLKEYRLVQAPGKNNALGKYRFNIPNNHSVYLHDTPAKSLFSKSYRALSHGCVRLQHPEKLAKHILSFETSQAGIEMTKAQHSKRTKHLKLPSPIPVYITYQSVWFSGTNEIHWHADIYQLDSSHSDATVSNHVLAHN